MDAITQSLAKQVADLTKRNAALVSALDGIISYCIGYGGHMALVIIDKARAAIAQEPPLFTPHTKDVEDHSNG